MIFGPQLIDEENHVVKITDLEEKESILQRIKNNDEINDIQLEGSPYINNYDNDDYLYVSTLIESIRNLHKLQYYNIYENKWIRGHSEIPNVHLVFYEKAVLKVNEKKELLRDELGNFISDDAKLNMSITPSKKGNYYNIEINYYWLRQYVKFLHKIFDDNEEIYFEIPRDKEIGISYSSKESLLKQAKDLEDSGMKEQADEFKRYIDSFIDETQIPAPILFIHDDGKNQKATLAFYNKEQHTVATPLKKQIYNTTGFASHFYNRNSLVYDIFENSLKMMIAHEIAHLARGHLNLRKYEPKYSSERNVMMNCEIQADHTGAKWLINELRYETVTDDPYFPVLGYSRKSLIYNWSVRIFSAYLALSWGYRNDERLWDDDTITAFCNRLDATHPPYQFRTYCVLNHIRDHLDHMIKESKKEGCKLYTADRNEINEELINDVWSKSMDMILSFEESFKITWNKDERTMQEKFQDNIKITNYDKPKNINEIPFMMAYMEQAQDELNTYEEQWPEILNKLRKYGMYFVM